MHAETLVKEYHCKHPLDHKSRKKVRVRTLSNWTPQSTPSTSLLLLSSRLLASITPPTGKKPLSKPPCPLALSNSLPSLPPPSRPLHFPPRQPVPPSPMPRHCLPVQCSQLSTHTPTCLHHNSVSSFTVLPSRSRPAPLSMPPKSPASKTSSPTWRRTWVRSPSDGTLHPKATFATTTSSPTSTSCVSPALGNGFGNAHWTGVSSGNRPKV